MKTKILFITLLVLFSFNSYSQIVICNNAANVTANYGNSTPIAKSDANRTQAGMGAGSVVLYTNAAFNGTTATDTLQVSNDNIHWANAYQSDNVTVCAFTVNSASKAYPFVLNSIQYHYYRIKWTKGDATTGAIFGIIGLP